VRRALRKANGDTVFWRLDLPRETSAYVPRLLALAAVVADPGAHGIELPELLPTATFLTIDTHGQFDLMKAAAALEVSVDLLYDWNPALNQWATPPNGPHTLHVPVTLRESAQARISAVPEDERVQWLRVEVAQGDTLSHIARRYRTDVATLRRVNRLTGTGIRAGQALYIPRSTEAPAAYPIATRKPEGDYQVKPGDSLWSIARAHQVPLARLIKANEIGPKEVLGVGQRLSIPGAESAAGSPGIAGRDVIRKVRYGVRRGDSLARIASKFNVAIGDLAQWNQIDPRNYLQPGQKLLIYVNVAAAE
jgi:membrane-bound lytic murein transglycosylase D